MSASGIKITEGADKTVATYSIEEDEIEKELPRTALNDESGAPLAGQRPRADSLPATLSVQDIIAILAAGAPAQGFVPIPASNETALTTPVRAVLVTAAGNLGLELADGSNNSANTVAVASGMVFHVAAVRRTSTNSAGVIGLVGLPPL